MFTKIGNINATLETLTLDCNPSTPSFGNPGRTSSSGVAFKFADDSKTVRKAILEPLAMFINERFTAIKTALAGPAGMVQATKEYEKLTSQAFKVMFKKYRADQESAHLGMCWKTIECPVAPSMTNCETHVRRRMQSQEETPCSSVVGARRCAIAAETVRRRAGRSTSLSARSSNVVPPVVCSPDDDHMQLLGVCSSLHYQDKDGSYDALESNRVWGLPRFLLSPCIGQTF